MHIINFFKHFKKVYTHKFWVFVYCLKAGIPLQGLFHDMSKFSPIEFFISSISANFKDSAEVLCCP